MSIIRKNLWIGAILFGLVMFVLGGFFVAKGISTKAMITNALAQEKVTASTDSDRFGGSVGAPVVDAKTAQAQADVIEYHSLNSSKGLRYSEMTRDDPARQTYLNGLVLRNSLSMATMGFGIADFAVAVGAVLMVIGAAGIVLVAPSLYWLRQPEEVRVRGIVPQPVGAVAGK